MKAFYDLHIHSCLSPCGNDDMTPINIVNMARLTGLDIIALTDHNSCKNCPAFMHNAKRAGLIAVPGMELCTAEECHVICLFPTLDGAMAFDELVERTLPKIENDPEVFGTQTIMNAEDLESGSYPVLLATASSISIDDVAHLTRKFGGTAFPSHIARPSYSVISSLGTVPELGFRAFEITELDDSKSLEDKHPVIRGRNLLCNSDAHDLEDIHERDHWLELDAATPVGLISALNREKSM